MCTQDSTCLPRGGEDLYSHSFSWTTRFFRANPIASRHRVYPGIIQSTRTSELFQPGAENRRIVYANSVRSFCTFFLSFSCRHSCTKVYTSFFLSFLIFPRSQSLLSHFPSLSISSFSSSLSISFLNLSLSLSQSHLSHLPSFLGFTTSPVSVPRNRSISSTTTHTSKSRWIVFALERGASLRLCLALLSLNPSAIGASSIYELIHDQNRVVSSKITRRWVSEVSIEPVLPSSWFVTGQPFFPHYVPFVKSSWRRGSGTRRKRRIRRRGRVERLSPWSGRKGRKKEGEINKKKGILGRVVV